MTQTSTPRTLAMQVKTLLNRVHPVNRFVYDKVQWADDHKQPDGVRIDVSVRPRRGSRGICSGVENAGPDMTISMNVVSTSSRGGVLPWLLVYVRDAAGQLIRGAG